MTARTSAITMVTVLNTFGNYMKRTCKATIVGFGLTIVRITFVTKQTPTGILVSKDLKVKQHVLESVGHQSLRNWSMVCAIVMPTVLSTWTAA